MNTPMQKLANAVDAPGNLSPNKTAHPVFIGGILYPSLFEANIDSGIRSVSIWKAVQRRGGGPAQVRKSLVVMESWVTLRAEYLKRNYEI